jgi:O-antigen ligase
MAARLQRARPLAIWLIVVGLGGVAGALASHRAHHLGLFELVVLGMAAGAAGASAVMLLEPAWILTAGLLLSVFSGNWGNMGIPIPLDRVAIAAGIIAAIVQSRRSPDGRRIELRTLHLLMLLLVLYAVASAAWSGTLTSHSPLFALLDRLGLVPFLLFLVAPVAFATTGQRQILLVGLLILGAYLGVTTLLEALGKNSLVFPHYITNPALGIHADRGRGPFLEAGANGLAMFACAVAAAITLPSWRSRWARAGALTVIGLCVAGLVFTLTRQTWVGAAVGTAAAMLADRGLRRWLPAVGVSVAAIVVVALALVPGLSSNVSQRTSDQVPVWDRLNSDAAALRMFEARPGLGFGWGTFGTASGPYYRLASTYPLTSVGVAHNVPLSNASELGVIGLALWAWILVAGLVLPAVRRAGPLEQWRIGLVAIAVAWFVQANFTPLDYAFDNYVVWLWAGIVVGAQQLASPAVHRIREPIRRGPLPEPQHVTA